MLIDLNAPFAVVDVETTGNRSDVGYVIEIGIIRIEQRQITDTFETLLSIPQLLTPFITRLTGIRDEDLADAPSFPDVLDRIRGLFDRAYFVAHNASFDYAFLKSEFQRCGTDFYMDRFCTVRLGRNFFPGKKHYNLDALMDLMGVTTDRRHRAMGDAMATAQIFLRYLDLPNAPEVFARYARSFERKDRWRERLEKKIAGLPESCGVYLFKDAYDLPLYVGKSTHIRSRVLGHLREDDHPRKRRLLRFTDHLDFIECNSELEALILEARLIKQHLPPYNVEQRRWKQQVFLRVTDDPYPKILVCESRSEEGFHVGPFRSPRFLEYVLQRLQKHFRLCPELMKPKRSSRGFCFSYHLRQCAGACGEAVPPDEYRATVLEAMDVLQEYTRMTRRETIDAFLKARDTRTPRLEYFRDALQRVKQQLREVPEMFTRRYLIVHPVQQVAYLICDGLLRKVFRGQELEGLHSIREFAMARDVHPPDTREALDERLTIQRYVRQNRHRLQMIPLDDEAA